MYRGQTVVPVKSPGGESGTEVDLTAYGEKSKKKKKSGPKLLVFTQLIVSDTWL